MTTKEQETALAAAVQRALQGRHEGNVYVKGWGDALTRRVMAAIKAAS